MPLAAQTMGAGFSAGQATILGGSFNLAVSAAGTTAATATALKAANNLITVAAANSGVILPSVSPGDSLVLFDLGANAVSVYPPTGHRLNNLTANTPDTLPTNTQSSYTYWGLVSGVGRWSVNRSA